MNLFEDNNNMKNDRATLIRKGTSKLWEFVREEDCGELIYRTRENIYGILPGMDCGKPCWIGKVVMNAGKDVWITVEAELRAERITFECGGVYIFPEL